MKSPKDECKCGKTKDKRAIQCQSCHFAEPAEKLCRGCNTVYKIEEYAFRTNGRGGFKRRSRCRSCDSKYMRERMKNNPEAKKHRRQYCKEYAKKHPSKSRLAATRRVWRKKGFTWEQVKPFYENKKACEICGRNYRLGIDHCHKTGVIRGILCTTCNAGLGHFMDDINKMKQAIKYLQKHQCKEEKNKTNKKDANNDGMLF